MVESYKSINKIALATIAGTLGIQIVNFLLIPILTHVLGTCGYGEISLYTAWCQIILAVCGLQTTQSILYINTEKKKEDRRLYYANMLACSSLSFLLSLLFSIVLIQFFGLSLNLNVYLVFFIFIQSFGNYCVNFVNAIYTIEQTPLKQVLLSLAVSITTATLSIILVLCIDDVDQKYWGRIFGYSFPYFIFGVIIIGLYIFPYLKKIRLVYVKEYLPICLPLIFHSLAGMIFSQSDRIMLGHFVGVSEVGIYSFTYSIASLLNVVWVTINNFFSPYFFLYLKNNDIGLLKEKVNNICVLYTCIYIIFLFIVPIFMPIYGGADFAQSVMYLPIMLIGIYFNFLYSFNSNFQSYYKETKNIATATVLSAIVNILLNLVLIPRYSIMGATCATLISNIFLFAFHSYSAYRISIKNKVEYVLDIKKFLFYASIAASFVLLLYIIKDLLFLRVIISLLIFIYISVITFKRKSII